MNISKQIVLTLNKQWMPVDVITARDCFRLLSKSHAEVLETANSTFMTHTMDSWIDLHMHEKYNTINTVTLEIPVPEIIILTEYSKVPDTKITFCKDNLLIRDKYKCVYCQCDLDMQTITIDHVLPTSKGGKTCWENCVSACTKCNHEKGHKLPIGEYKPKRSPKIPHGGGLTYTIHKKTKNKHIPNSWYKFLGLHMLEN